MRERNISQTVRSAGVAVLLLLPLILFGCSSMNQGAQARQLLAEANDLFIQGEYATSLDRYAQLLESHPDAKDRILFEMGIIYAHPKNEQKDYPQAVASFQQLIREHPESDYRQDSEMMLFYLDNVVAKDGIIAAQQARIEALQKEVAARESDNKELSGRIKLLEQKYFNLALQHGPVDKILIEKQARRLTLILKGEVLKAYKIALGGNPVGAKERQGDNKTPEGVYAIDAKNSYSQYHLSLRISYPNEHDRKRARELGVSPGGDIMIHGIKNGFSWVGDAHAEVDWTKGCIAVTDVEIEEIDRLAPIGTVVEIRP